MPNYKIIGEKGGEWQLMGNERARLRVYMCDPAATPGNQQRQEWILTMPGPLHLSSAPQAYLVQF